MPWALGIDARPRAVIDHVAIVSTVQVGESGNDPYAIVYNHYNVDLVVYDVATPTFPTTSDPGNRLRRISLDGVSTAYAGAGERGIADGIGTAAQLWGPVWLVHEYDPDLFIADSGGATIRKVTPVGSPDGVGEVVTLALTDGGSPATFDTPGPICAIVGGEYIYVFDVPTQLLRRINPFTFEVATVAGSGSGHVDGTGSAAKFDVAVSDGMASIGDDVYIAGGNYIRKCTPSSSDFDAPMVVTTVAGDGTAATVDGIGTAAQVQATGIAAVDVTLYFIDHNTVRQMTVSDGVVTTIAGAVDEPDHIDGRGPDARFGTLLAITSENPYGTNLYVVDDGIHGVRKIDISAIS